MNEFLTVPETLDNGKHRQRLKKDKAEHGDNRHTYQKRVCVGDISEEFFNGEILAHIRNRKNAHNGKHNKNERPNQFAFYITLFRRSRDIVCFFIFQFVAPFFLCRKGQNIFFRKCVSI